MITTKELSKRKKIKIAHEFIDGITNNTLGNIMLNIAILNDYKRYLKQKGDNVGKKEN